MQTDSGGNTPAALHGVQLFGGITAKGNIKAAIEQRQWMVFAGNVSHKGGPGRLRLFEKLMGEQWCHQLMGHRNQLLATE